MSRNKTNPSFALVLFHTVMVLITGGLWLIPLGIWFALKYFNQNKA